MKCLKCVLICVILLMLGAPCILAEEVDWEVANTEKVEKPPASVTLEYRFDVGEARRYDVTIAGDGRVQLPGQKEEAKLRSNSQLVFTERASEYLPTDEMWHVKWELAKGVQSMTGFRDARITIPSIEFNLGKSGVVKQVKGLEKLTAIPGMPPAKTFGDVLLQLKSLGFPKKELSPNDSWSNDYTVQLPNQKPITIKVTSTLVGFQRLMKADCAEIRTTYETPFSISLDEKADSQPAAPAAKESQKVLTGTEKGEFRTYFDYNGGKIVQSFGTVELAADVRDGGETEQPRPDTTEVSADGTASAGTATTAASHNLGVTWHITSVFNPEPFKQAAKGVKQ